MVCFSERFSNGDTVTLVKEIIEGCERNCYSLKGKNISMDRYYTFIPPAK